MQSERLDTVKQHDVDLPGLFRNFTRLNSRIKHSEIAISNILCKYRIKY